MAKKPMNVEEALDALGDVDGGVLQGEVAGTVLDESFPYQGTMDESVPPVRLSPAEEFAKWVAGQEWAAAYSDSVTRLLEEIQKRARALLPS